VISNSNVLITGAGGFIGGRVAEVLHCSGLATVRAGVRRWTSAARLGRLPIDIVQCDVTDLGQVHAALDGVSAVVHCAVGPRNVTVDGTRNMLEAALASGVKRFVHVSTIDVYGGALGEVYEESPYAYTGNRYGDSKIDAEKMCWAFMEKGLPICILRPTIVYGPFSAVWTIDIAERLLQSGHLPLAREYCQGTCNLLYVDDLVAAILLALRKHEAVGDVFNVNGAERPTWHEYFRVLNEAMGLAVLTDLSTAVSWLGAWVMKPVRSSAKFLLKHFENQIMAVYKSSDLARQAMRHAERFVRKSPTTAELQLYSKHAWYPTDKAAKLLGYKPQFGMAEGIQLSVAWLEHHGFLADRGSRRRV
jgi:nucleoside-diphosphate-sugar epimerase